MTSKEQAEIIINRLREKYSDVEITQAVINTLEEMHKD